MSNRAKEVQIDIKTMTVTVPVGQEPSMILVDPRQGKACKINLPLYGDTRVVTHQGQIKRVRYEEGEEF